MTKQEKIESGVKSIVRRHLPDNMGFDLDKVSANVAKEILVYEDSQGVVIKVDREMPYLQHLDYLKEGITSDEDLKIFALAIELSTKTEILKAGYAAVEPLIEEA